MVIEITMGHAPPRRGPRPLTQMELATRRYVNGAIELEDFEVLVGGLIAEGRESEIAPPPPPRKTPALISKPEDR